jgi:putative tryptophan/tyrosine transport system substrate-binding protein
MLLSLSFAVEAQQPTKVPRIGFLAAISPAAISTRIEAFRQGLNELGYIEGKNIVVEWRSDEGGRVPGLAAELVRLKVDVIVTAGPLSTRPAEGATKTIPIVMAQDDDPVGNGFVASLARPGGNITGLASLSPELSGKQLELLKEIVPKLSRMAVLGSPNRPGNAQSLRETELAAGAFGVKLQYLDVLGPKDIDTAFREAGMARADAVLMLVATGVPQRKQVVELAVKSRLPVISGRPELVEAGGPYDLRREHYRNVPTRRHLRGQNSEGSQAGRSAGGTADEV